MQFCCLSLVYKCSGFSPNRASAFPSNMAFPAHLTDKPSWDEVYVLLQSAENHCMKAIFHGYSDSSQQLPHINFLPASQLHWKQAPNKIQVMRAV